MVPEGLWFLKDLLRENTLTHTRLCPTFVVGILRTCLCAWIVSGERDWKSQRFSHQTPKSTYSYLIFLVGHLKMAPEKN